MAKLRTSVPDDVSAEVMFQHDRTCCVCRDPGRSVQIHHIDEDPNNHAIGNLAVLCLEHHQETQMRGGFIKRLGITDVRFNRDDWVRRVSDRRNKADDLFVNKMAGVSQPRGAPKEWTWPSEAEVVSFLKTLPPARTAAIEIMRSYPIARRNNQQMVSAGYAAIEFLKSAWLRLANFYPPECFDEMAADRYLSEFLGLRARWHRRLYEPRGPATGGTIVRVLVVGGLFHDIETLIEDTAESLFKGYSLWDIASQWRNDWSAASAPAGNSPGLGNAI